MGVRICEYVFRFNRRLYPFNGFRSLLELGALREAPTYDELYSVPKIVIDNH